MARNTNTKQEGFSCFYIKGFTCIEVTPFFIGVAMGICKIYLTYAHNTSENP